MLHFNFTLFHFISIAECDLKKNSFITALFYLFFETMYSKWSLSIISHMVSLSVMVTLCSVLSWCPVWKTFPVQSVWSCAASAGNSSNRARKMPTKSAVSRFVTHCFCCILASVWNINTNQHGYKWMFINLFLIYFCSTQKKKDYEIEMNRYLLVSILLWRQTVLCAFFAPFSVWFAF